MKNLGQITEEIHVIAKGVFEFDHIKNFVSKVQSLLDDESPIDCILQVSTDEGNELELGFFTSTKIADVTLSKGNVYFYAYPVSTIKNIGITDADSKWTLTIVGEKKFDYNVVKPADNTALSNYEQSLKAHLSSRHSLKTDEVFLSPYNPEWTILAEKEIRLFQEIFAGLKCEIHHIGSTAIPGLSAKPVIDLLVGVESTADADQTIGPLEKIGYSFWRDNPNKWHYFFVKGFLSSAGLGGPITSILWRRGTIFLERKSSSDYLRSNQDDARAYETLKNELSRKFPKDRDAYTNGKTDFVNTILKKAGMVEK